MKKKSILPVVKKQPVFDVINEVVSTNLSRLEAHAVFFRLSMKGKFDVYLPVRTLSCLNSAEMNMAAAVTARMWCCQFDCLACQKVTLPALQ